MSLKLFFNRKSPMVLSLTLVGWALGLYHLIVLFLQTELILDFATTTFLIFSISALLLSLVRLYPWYARQDRGHGIEEHFAKNLVPLAYMLVLSHGLSLISPGSGLLYALFSFCLLPFHAVNGILLYFHFRDEKSDPPTFLSREDFAAKIQ